MKTVSGWVLVVLVALGFFASGRAQEAPGDAAATMTPGGARLLVNKSVGPERWSISVNLANPDGDEEPHRIASITGNVFADDGEVSFVYCQVRPDSTGSLDDPESTFRLTCKGTGPCDETALACARDRLDVDLARRADPVVVLPAAGRPAGFGDAGGREAGALGKAVARLTAWIGDRLSLRGWNEAHAQQSVEGATLSIDLLNHLVVRDRGTQRWAIAFNFARATSVTIGVVPRRRHRQRLRSERLTGVRLLRPARSRIGLARRSRDGGAPALLRRRGVRRCALDCADEAGPRSTADIPIEAGFFLPDDGRGSPATSESGLVVLGGSERCDHHRRGSDQGCGHRHVVRRGRRLRGRPHRRVRERSRPQDQRRRRVPLPGRTGAAVLHANGYRDGARGDRLQGRADHGGLRCPVQVRGRRSGRGRRRAGRAQGPRREPAALGRGRDLLLSGEPAGKGARGRVVRRPGRRDAARTIAAASTTRATAATRSTATSTASGVCIAGSRRRGRSALRSGYPARRRSAATARIQGSELCDPGSDPAATCASLGFESGELACTAAGPRAAAAATWRRRLERLDTVGEIDKHGRQVVYGQFFDPDGDVAEVQLTSTSAARRLLPDRRRRGGGAARSRSASAATASSPPSPFDVRRRPVDGQAQPVDRGGQRSQVSCAEPLCGDGTIQEWRGVRFRQRRDRGGVRCRSRLSQRLHVRAGQLLRRTLLSIASSGFCGHAELECRCDAECRERGDCCGDARAECGL